jgi:hypothetical protein
MSKKPLSWAMQAFLIEQMVSTVGTLVFAGTSLVSSILTMPPINWNSLGPELSTFIRLVIFLAMLHSTLYLSRETKRILKEEQSKKTNP